MRDQTKFKFKKIYYEKYSSLIIEEDNQTIITRFFYQPQQFMQMKNASQVESNSNNNSL